jgi:cytochrome c oxidase cbb3-type subunit 4
MFSFIKKYAETLQGVDIYPKISLLIFFTVFCIIIIALLKMSKKTISELERIPLD